MPRQFIHTHISTITDTKSTDSSEDTYFVYHDGQRITLMVADGASQRLKTTGSLQPMLSQYGNGTSPGRYAASLTRDVAAEKTVIAQQMQVRDIPLAANQRLRQELDSIYGELSSAAVLQKEPTLTKLQDDPRFVRLILPICCITVARLDLLKGTLSYAHGGDTALFLLYRDGRTVQVTPDQMGQHDDKMRRELRYVLQNHQPKDEAEFRALTSKARTLNMENGLYHNYEDERGDTDASVGVGVINGMSQLENYLVADTIGVDDLEAFVLTTDGMFWPALLDETVAESQTRVNYMGDLIRQHGIHSYLQALHEEKLADSSGERYQRFAKIDDATAIYVRLTKG
jgi:serine/threonine protein phosphatase PrpC